MKAGSETTSELIPGRRRLSWPHLLSTGGAVFLGGVLLFAAYAKAIDPLAFIQQIRMEELDFLLGATAVAFIALALEVGLGVLLLLGLRRLWVLVPTAWLVLFFLFLTGRNYWLVSQGLRPETTSCGCFGSLIERTPAEAFYQDLFLLVPPLLLAFWGRRREQGTPWVRLSAAGAATMVVLALVAMDPDLAFTELATREPVELKDYRPSDLYSLRIDGEEVAGARILHSEESASFLILSEDLGSPVVLRPREEAVETVDPSYLRRDAQGALDLSEDARLNEQGKFQVGAEGVLFEINGRQVELRPRQ